MFKETQQTTSANDDEIIDTLKNRRKRNPKWTVKEVPHFDGDPNEWVKQIKSMEDIMGQIGYKNKIESQVMVT